MMTLVRAELRQRVVILSAVARALENSTWCVIGAAVYGPLYWLAVAVVELAVSYAISTRIARIKRALALLDR